MDSRMRAALDRHITGNWGEDQFKGLLEPCKCGHPYEDHYEDGECADIFDQCTSFVPADPPERDPDERRDD